MSNASSKSPSSPSCRAVSIACSRDPLVTLSLRPRSRPTSRARTGSGLSAGRELVELAQQPFLRLRPGPAYRLGSGLQVTRCEQNPQLQKKALQIYDGGRVGPIPSASATALRMTLDIPACPTSSDATQKNP